METITKDYFTGTVVNILRTRFEMTALRTIIPEWLQEDAFMHRRLFVLFRRWFMKIADGRDPHMCADKTEFLAAHIVKHMSNFVYQPASKPLQWFDITINDYPFMPEYIGPTENTVLISQELHGDNIQKIIDAWALEDTETRRGLFLLGLEWIYTIPKMPVIRIEYLTEDWVELIPVFHFATEIRQFVSSFDSGEACK